MKYIDFLCRRLESIEKHLQHINDKLHELQEQQIKLAKSDRRQWQRLKTQHRLTITFSSVVIVGALMLFHWPPEHQKQLRELAIALITAGSAGVLGTNVRDVQPPSSEDTRNESGSDSQ